MKTNLENEKEKLEGMIKENKDFEGEIRLKDKQIVKLRTHLKLLRAKRRDLEGNVEITKNRLSAESTLLQKKRTQYENDQQKLLNNKQRLKKTQKTYKNQKRRLENEEAMISDLKTQNKTATEFL